VEIHLARDGERAVLTLDDDGPGVPREKREAVFEPFFTERADGAGMGMGLTVSRAIVAAHDGRLALLDKAGRGARFQLSLPRYQP
jgi:C4-dicarboxylate-specific signal transduction histidine kinase